VNDKSGAGPMDPLLVQSFWSRLTTIVEQQAAALIRTSFTPAVSECGDLSACVFDPRGRMIAQAVTGTPGHINSMAHCVRDMLALYPPETLRPGDVLITNDPWLTSGHHYDVTVVTPVFSGPDLIALFGSICHTADFGGRPYGPDGVDVYEEGLEIPVLKLLDGGATNEQLLQIIRANVRAPEQVVGDIFSQVAGNAVGARQLLGFMDEAGLASIVPLADEIIARTEKAMRAAIEALPDGTYRYTTQADGFEEPVTLLLTIRVDGDHLVADYAGTSPQVKQAINVVMNYTEAYTTFGVKCALAPEVPNNEGSFRAVEVRAPRGSILNCERPAPVAARHLMGHFLPGLVLAALSPVMPDRAMAEGAAALWSTNVHGRTTDGDAFSLLSFMTGGTGARAGLDGLSTTAFPSGVSGIPVEVFENRCPLVMLERGLSADSGGPGRLRGGLGQRVRLAAPKLLEPYRLSLFADRIHNPAPGLEGGHAGQPGEAKLGDGRALDPKRTAEIRPGDEVILVTPGGGGLGPPEEREPAAVAEDLLNGLVSRDAAERVYRVVVRSDGTIDPDATDRFRSQ
jgi:N-methylhydantoinase B